MSPIKLLQNKLDELNDRITYLYELIDRDHYEYFNPRLELSRLYDERIELMKNLNIAMSFGLKDESMDHGRSQ